MKRTLFGLVALSLGMAAYAQAPVVDTTGLSVRLGFVHPFSKTTRDITGNMFGLGLDYELQKSLVQNGTTHLSIDWYGKSASGKKGNMYPMMLNQKFFTDKNQLEGRRTYFLVGVGAVLMDINTSGFALAGKLGAGTELGSNLFAEAHLLASEEKGGTRANSIGVFVGWKL